MSTILPMFKKCRTIWIKTLTPPFEDEFKIEEQSNTNNQSLLFYGYIRAFEHNQQMCIIPNEIVKLILYFYLSSYIMESSYIIDGTYRCQQKSTGKQFVVKILNKNKCYRIPSKFRVRYLRALCDELEILSCMDHRYIVNIEYIFEDKYSTYIVSQECKGGTLLHRIIQKGQFTEYDAAEIMRQILSALRYMHEENNIVHCHLSPQNIYFVDESDDLSVKIDGFGMSKVIPRLQSMNYLGPTPYYTAPEIVKHKKYNHCCDMWSLGIILYLMTFGYTPFYVEPEKYGKAEQKALYKKICRGFEPKVRSTEKYGFGPWFPDHITVSAELKDFISKLLQRRLRNRYTAKEALMHPWIVNRAKNSQIYPDQNLLMQSLAKFSNIYEFKSNVITLFRDQFNTMRSNNFAELITMCIEIDTDNDGVIYCHEFMDVISQMKHINIDKKWMHLLFQNHKQSGIHYDSLLYGLTHDYLVFCDQLLYRAFRKLDDDNDGKITIQQLKDTFKSYDKLNEWSQAIQIITGNGLDSDGFIDYEEFLWNLHPSKHFEDIMDKYLQNTR